jgi:hypothetical protein
LDFDPNGRQILRRGVDRPLPPVATSSGAYCYIAANLNKWVEESIRIRQRYS